MQRITGIILVSVLLTNMQSGHAATLAEGAKCKKINSITKSDKQSFVCLKSGKSLVLVAKFKKCAEAISAGRAPIVRDSEPLLYAANAGLDRDKDGTACDQ